jgi:endonuclease/exonuclease/phosphatase family metal-dependent hydrolase
VLTLNVRNDEGDLRRIDMINREIRRLEPDLVALQEVAIAPSAADAQTLLAGTGLDIVHQSDVLSYAMPYADRYGGTAIGIRWAHGPVVTLDQRVAGAPDVPWCTLATTVTVPDVGELLFVGTTSSWRLDAEDARERQALALTDLDARHRAELPSILAGDFNAGPDASSIRYLRGQQSLHGHSVHYHDAWAVAHSSSSDPGHTWTVDNPDAAEEIDAIVGQPGHRHRLDYVFIGSWHIHPGGRAVVADARLVFDQPVDGLRASDHYGLLVDLDVTGASQAR